MCSTGKARIGLKAESRLRRDEQAFLSRAATLPWTLPAELRRVNASLG